MFSFICFFDKYNNVVKLLWEMQNPTRIGESDVVYLCAAL